MSLTRDCFSIILPVHNQASHIAEVVHAYIAALTAAKIDYELILVTNACTDNSADVCRRLALENSNLVAIDTEQSGWGHAVKVGLKAASGNVICYTNSARTTPEILTLTLLYAKAFPSVVIKTNRKIRDNWRRRLGSLLYNLECRALFDLPNWDVNGTPKIFPRSFERLLTLKSEDDLIDAEFNAICRVENYPILEVPVLAIKRHGGKSTTNYYSAWKMYWGAFDLWRKMAQTQKQ